MRWIFWDVDFDAIDVEADEDARRGIRRDFWDLFVIARSGHELGDMARDYLRKFGREESDLYHVLRALTYFADAEADPLLPRGMTPELWEAIKTYFEREAPKLLFAEPHESA
jgi:hypothetical protein